MNSVYNYKVDISGVVSLKCAFLKVSSSKDWSKTFHLTAIIFYNNMQLCTCGKLLNYAQAC